MLTGRHKNSQVIHPAQNRENRLCGIHIRKGEFDVVYRSGFGIGVGNHGPLLLFEVPIQSEFLKRVLSDVRRTGLFALVLLWYDARYGGDLGKTGRLGAFGGHDCAPAFEGGLVCEAPFAAEGVLEGDEEHEADTNEGGKEPERCTPAERLCQYATEDGA